MASLDHPAWIIMDVANSSFPGVVTIENESMISPVDLSTQLSLWLRGAFFFIGGPYIIGVGFAIFMMMLKKTIRR